MEHDKRGLAAAVSAFLLWGLLPLFWNQLSFLDPFSIVAQRTVWSLLLLLPILLWRRETRLALSRLAGGKALGLSIASSLLLGSNWVMYVWATLNQRILDTSLGYYLNPFFNMLFGVLWFGERHGPLRRVAIGLALAGVLLQFPAVDRVPWISVALASTFSLYAVIGKISGIGARVGVTLDSALLLPVALAWLALSQPDPAAAFGGCLPHAAWVVATGLATTLPLVLFGHAARRLPLSTLGILQFLSPSLQFFLGWLVYGEPLPPLRFASFLLLWTAIALYLLPTRGKRGSTVC